MACEECGSEHSEGECKGVAASLLGFLHEFRHATNYREVIATPTPGPASTGAPAPGADLEPWAAYEAGPDPELDAWAESPEMWAAPEATALRRSPSWQLAPGWGPLPPPSAALAGQPAHPPPSGPPGRGHGVGGTPWAPRRPRWRLPVIVGVLTAIAITAAVAVDVVGRRSGPSYPSAWDPRVAAIATFVQDQRGLTWKHPVKVEFLPVAQFESKVNGSAQGSGSAPADQQYALDAMRAVGVVSGNIDLGSASGQLAANNVVGVYTYQAKTVYVKGSELTPDVKATLTHELTHALQDQYFNLERLTSGSADDESAVTALVEGDATRVEQAYIRSLPADQKRVLAQEQQQQSSQAASTNLSARVPQFLDDQVQFPYDFGPTFVATLLQQGGNSEVDQAFRSPPTLDAQIVNPSSYHPGESVPPVQLPRLGAGTKVLDPPTGFGQVPLLEMLGDEIGFGPAWPAVEGWASDQIVVYQRQRQVCINLSVLTDTPADAAAMGSAGRRWAAHLRGATVHRVGRTVNFQSCDPGVAWRPGPEGTDPYEALATRALVIDDLVINVRINEATASCATDKLLSSVGPQALARLETSPGTGAATSRTVVAIRTALITCGNAGRTTGA